jgi:hypothetical protein
MSAVPYAACSSAASGSWPEGTELLIATGYWSGWGSSGAYCAGELALYELFVGWSAWVGIMYCSMSAHAALNFVQSPEMLPYMACSQMS